ncbi:transporter substrate-binding domain-containing protein [Shinella zoogloeoides]|uniref:transporter substrate-binding domain-containing protein n=1 Tax=Shinella zoogloeoides TaxID=352475 RepID=UPI000E64D243|nr:transporter substrate-binding domain-containing protein [Shinella zoogloeoides]WPE23713.1 Lysine/arginine/ornithine-binding periplasmic protein [Shinella zoogloeoides]
MKFMIGLLSAAIVGLAGAMPAHAETLRVGMECTYAPFNYRTPEGEMAGYDVDVAKGIAERIGVDLEYVCQEWDGMLPALLASKFDLIVASMSITEERKQKIDFSIPYRVSLGRILGAKDAGLKLFDDAGKPNPEAFNGLRFGVERASTYAKWVEAKLPGAEIVLYDGAQPMLLDLQNGRIDIAITNPMKAYLDFLSKENGAGFEFVSPPIDEVEYFGPGVGVGLRKGNDELLAKIDKALEDMIKDGSLEKYSSKYFPFSIQPSGWKGVGE